MSAIAIRRPNRGPAAAAALVVAGGLLAALAPAQAQGAVINYGNSSTLSPGVTFLNVAESSGTDAVPLFGAPEYFTTGVDFDPTTFVASAVAGGGDVTDGQLNFVLQGDDSPSQLVAIDRLDFFEAGDFTLTGTGTAATQVTMGLSVQVTVTEIDGAPVTPFNLTPVNASTAFNLAGNPGTAQPWTLGALFDIQAQLTALGKSHTVGATRVEVAINDTLVGLSQSGSAAFGAKRDFRVEVVPDVDAIPEPAALSLMALAAPLLARRRR